jgi:hypothetical protein
MRTHRTSVQKLLYSDTFRCTKCGRRLNQFRTLRSAMVTFAFSRHTHCIRCGTPHVHRLSKRDRIDSVSRHPLSLLFALIGAPLNKCSDCRLQYRDWRRPDRRALSY